MTLFDEPRDWGPTFEECKLCKTWRPQSDMMGDTCIPCGTQMLTVGV